MEHYAGLDVSLKLTAVCVIDERGRVVTEGKVPSEPDAIAAFLQLYAATLSLAGLEAGLLAPYLYSGLVEHGVRAVCIETRHMKAFAKASPVKTDRKDAHLIPLAMKAGLYRAVHVKTDESQRLRFLLTARELLCARCANSKAPYAVPSRRSACAWAISRNASLRIAPGSWRKGRGCWRR